MDTKEIKRPTVQGVRAYLAIGSLPKGASYIRRSLGKFRLALERSVLDKEGEICLYNAALIQTVVRHEGRAQLLTRWLRIEDADLKVADKAALLREIGSASDTRDKCLRLLGLDTDVDKPLPVGGKVLHAHAHRMIDGYPVTGKYDNAPGHLIINAKTALFELEKACKESGTVLDE